MGKSVFDQFVQLNKNIVGGAVATVGQLRGLPETGLSERITGSNQQTSPWLGGTPPPYKPAEPIQLTSSSTGNTTANPNATTIAGGVSGSGGGFNSQSYLDLIEQDYNANIQALGNQEGELRAQSGLTQEQMATGYGQAEQQVEGLRGKTLGTLNQAATDVGTTSTSAQQDARRAYNELAQKNMAQLSAMGISSSSAAEAMQEGLSTNTFNALNQIITNRDQSLQKITTSKASAEEYYNQQVTNLKTSLRQAQDQISIQLTAALHRIEEARTGASAQKMAARNSVIQQAQSASYSAAQTSATNQQYLDAWKSQKDVADNTLYNILADTGKYQTINPDDILNNLKNANKELIAQGFPGIDIAKTIESYSPSTATATSLPKVYYSNRKYDAYGNVIKTDQYGNPIT